MRYRNRPKSEQQTVLIAIVFAVAGGLVLITPTSINFQLALAQEEQGQQQQQQPSSTFNDTLSSSSPMTGADSETAPISSATDNETGIGEPLPSPIEMNATMLRGEIGSIQSAHQGTFSWSTAGE
jgi:hypothetical protein